MFLGVYKENNGMKWVKALASFVTFRFAHFKVVTIA